MKNDFFSYLDGFNLISVIVPKQIDKPNKTFQLDAENESIPLIIKEVVSLGRETKYICEFNETIELNQAYILKDEEDNQSFLRMGKIVRTDLFDMMFEYDDLDLGVTYQEEETIFKIWSPVAKEIELELIRTNGSRQFMDLLYETSGLWQLTVKDNLDGCKYRYRVRVNERFKTIRDPYGIASTANGQYNYVVNPAKFRKFKHPKPEFSGKKVDSIIYEASIRDLTSSKTSKSIHKGMFKGLTEDIKGQGLDYIMSLGVTHLQLLPIYDFEGVDELNPKESYNWGYNPSQFNVVEGSFTQDPNDPYQRINELIELIDLAHSKGLRVNMDVVYNHVFNMNTFPYESLVPGYFFRFDKNGIRTDSSGCGNDVASERIMVHHFIIQSIKYWMRTFNISGFRFDLMGLLDLETMTKIEIEAKQIDPDVMIYGEGWNMESYLPENLKSHMDNAKYMPNIAFFNDKFRETIKGGTFSSMIGYALGAKVSRSDLYYLFTGSSVDFYKFINPNQSLNYVECHDNHTFHDRARILRKDLNDEQIKDYAALSLAYVVLSQGIPFIHAGEEFLRSKQGIENSYKSPDSINEINWDLKEKHADLVQTLRDLIDIRKTYRVFRLDSNSKIKKQIRISDEAPQNKTIQFVLNNLNQHISIYFKNDYEKELLTPGKQFKLMFDGVKKNNNGFEYLASKPGAYIFIEE